MSATDQFVENPQLTAIAIGYRNPDVALIADDVLPRQAAPGLNFRWQDYNEADNFTVPKTKVGRRSQPNRVEIEGTERSASCEDFGIDIPLDNPTIDEAKKNKRDIKGQATERATNIVMLDREIRVAGLISNPASYHADHVEALSGGDMFDDPASDPLTAIEDMLATCWMRPNQLAFGHTSWMAIRKHPKVVSAVLGNSGKEGRVTRQQVADLLEVNRIVVGAGRVNVARPGEAPVLERVWGNVIAGQFVDRTANTTGGITFGYTATHGKKIAGTLGANIGVRGGVLVRSAETIKELIVANRAGFLLQNVVAPS